MCSPKLHVEVNGFGVKKKGQADLMCKSNQRHLEPTLEYETTLPSPTNLKERIKMQSRHLYQMFSGIPTTKHPHPEAGSTCTDKTGTTGEALSIKSSPLACLPVPPPRPPPPKKKKNKTNRKVRTDNDRYITSILWGSIFI